MQFGYNPKMHASGAITTRATCPRKNPVKLFDHLMLTMYHERMKLFDVQGGGGADVCRTIFSCSH